MSKTSTKSKLAEIGTRLLGMQLELTCISGVVLYPFGQSSVTETELENARTRIRSVCSELNEIHKEITEWILSEQ